MKAAAFWWGRHLSIETWPLGEPHGWKVEIDLGEAGSKPQGTAAVRQIAARADSGTRITVDGLWQNSPVASKTRAAVGAYLPSIYRKFISLADAEAGLGIALDGSHLVRLYLDGRRLSFEPPKLLSAPYWPSPEGPQKGARSRVWRRKVKLRLTTGKEIEGWIGILDTMSRELSGFTLHYRGKGIGGVTPLDGSKDSNSGFRPREIFGQSGSYRAQSYIGEFDVTALGKSITTDSTLWSPDEEAEFVSHILAKLKDPKFDMWSMAVNFKRRKRAKTESSRLQKASGAAASQLGSAVSGEISHGQSPEKRPPAVPVKPSVRFVITDKEVHTHQFALGFTSDREHAFLTVDEDGAQRNHVVVLNENHPLFDDLPPVDVKVGS